MNATPIADVPDPSNGKIPEPPPPDADWASIRAWRKQTRSALIHERSQLPPHTRRVHNDRVRRHLLDEVDLRRFRSIGFYYPIRGELGFLDIARDLVARGGIAALPVVVERSAPVEFWRWSPGDRMRRGLWDIPIPAERELVTPEALVVPLVGFDSQRYRLGYGGGYYDRTLASMNPRPFCVGVGFSTSRLPTIFPQAHDIPMDAIVTDQSFIGAVSRLPPI